MLITNARVGDAIVDLRLRDGVITELGVLGGTGLDLQGRWLIPGLWDEHVHFTQWALARRRLDLQAAASAREVAVLVADAVAHSAVPVPVPVSRRLFGGSRDEPAVIVGTGFRDALWPDAPTRAMLDVAAPNTPVVLISGDVHSCWLNSRALERFGFAGHDTGLLREDESFAMVRRLDGVAADQVETSIADAAEAAAARGVVGITDLEFGWNFDAWRSRMDAGFDLLRVDAGIYPEHLEKAIGLGLSTGQRLTGLLSVGPAKIISDGSLNTRTAYCVDPYPGVGDLPHGMLNVQPGDLVEYLRRASGNGLLPAVHAIGDEANQLALDAFEAVGCRGRIEHAQLLRWEDLRRFAELGIVASVQPEHALDDRDVADRYWNSRTDRAFMLRSLLDAGATLKLGSDAPVAELDPWISIAAAVSRSKNGREPWHAEQSITVDEAIAASVRSSITVGQPADLVVLEHDPREATADQLRAMPVAATMLAGRFTHNTL
ncbi:amidohydrolase [Salinibacterium sp. ZJ454]|uniref:amidohydrolase n=1 Tax=Salinibacterium sp. ZJ454 TaxID=2708339 RepID=UPI0014240B16|nr:amidohydrolase [Salinibacterium sp. ZJ454]